MPGLELDVTDTNIQCYSGCLTSSNVVVTGASDDCHDGSIMQRFLIVLGIGFGVVLLSTIVYRHRSSLNVASGNRICTDMWRYICCCVDSHDRHDGDNGGGTSVSDDTITTRYVLNITNSSLNDWMQKCLFYLFS